jgi:hypothetical protein
MELPFDFDNFVDSLTFQGAHSNNKEKSKRLEELRKKIAQVYLAWEMYPDAKRICWDCFTPIYEIGGQCPNC